MYNTGRNWANMTIFSLFYITFWVISRTFLNFSGTISYYLNSLIIYDNPSISYKFDSFIIQ